MMITMRKLVEAVRLPSPKEAETSQKEKRSPFTYHTIGTGKEKKVVN